ncbi:MAG: M67 family metallopeptidase [Chloroflexota bacterium]|nr:M67 family metallopeptidase [Chloroflexota bacterium]
MTVGAEPLRLSLAIRDEIIDHAQAELPRECCGVIAGIDGQATGLYRLTNIEAGNRLYRVDDTELYRIYREIDEQGGEFLAIYHSHPVSPAYPSATDVELAFWADAYYVICSLAVPAAPEVRAFRIRNEVITEPGLITI